MLTSRNAARSSVDPVRRYRQLRGSPDKLGPAEARIMATRLWDSEGDRSETTEDRHAVPGDVEDPRGRVSPRAVGGPGREPDDACDEQTSPGDAKPSAQLVARHRLVVEFVAPRLNWVRVRLVAEAMTVEG